MLYEVITAYIRLATLSSSTGELRFSPGNPSIGKKVFKQKNCINCHRVDGEEESTGPNLSALHLNYSVTEIAAQIRITSYNVCYTKLLRRTIVRPSEIGNITTSTRSSLARASFSCRRACVSAEVSAASATWPIHRTLSKRIKPLGRSRLRISS